MLCGAVRDDRAVPLLDACIFDHCQNGAGERLALVHDNICLSYDGLGNRVSETISELNRIRIRPQSVLLLSLSETIDFVVSFFAAIGAGLYVVPISPYLSTRDLALLVAAFKPRAVLTEPERTAGLNGLKRINSDLAIITSDICSQSNTPAATKLIRPSCIHEEYSYGVLTSGTSGIPKLVLRRHEDIAIGWSSYARVVLGMKDSDVVYSTAPFCFGYGLGSGLIFPLLSGGTAVLGGPTGAAERIKHTKPSILFSQPATLRDFAASLDAADLRNTRVTISAGERMPRSLPERWMSQFGHPLLDGYGTTEIGHVFVSQTFEHMLTGSVGRAIPGFSLDIVEADGRICESGEPGILRVRAPTRVSSYYLDAAATRETFENDWVLTPDIATISPEGDVFILGRSNDVIRVGSDVISLGALEQCVMDLPFVKECCFSKVNFPDPSRSGHLMLDVVLTGTSSEPAHVRKDIARAIKIMVSQAVVDEEDINFVEAIARNANGKLVGSRKRTPLSAQFKC